MKIGIDARLINETGVGRYIRNLIGNLSLVDTENQYVVYLTKEDFDTFVLPNKQWEKRCADIHWHTLKEQLFMPRYFLKDNLDLVHVPYFNVPIFYAKPFVLTIHDLTVFHITTGKATTLPYPLYVLKKCAYVFQLWVGLHRAKKIIAVSETTKQEILSHFHIPKERIIVTYEGMEEDISRVTCDMSQEMQFDRPYFLYVGNAYPHKNLSVLFHAFADFVKHREKENQFKFILVGKQDVFYNSMQELVKTLGIETHVEFLGHVDDKTLSSLYRHATAFVFPSKMEGFGLPLLEALTFGCPVIASDIPVFRELFGTIPSYFSPDDAKALCLLLEKAAEGKLKHDVPKELLKRFSWRVMAEKTLTYAYSTGV